jgi:hypothetical protein
MTIYHDHREESHLLTKCYRERIRQENSNTLYLVSLVTLNSSFMSRLIKLLPQHICHVVDGDAQRISLSCLILCIQTMSTIKSLKLASF